MFRYTDQLQDKEHPITELSLSGTTLTLTQNFANLFQALKLN
jgi:hypothetical protein